MQILHAVKLTKRTLTKGKDLLSEVLFIADIFEIQLFYQIDYIYILYNMVTVITKCK